MAHPDDIQKLYIAYFNRPADPGGLAYWQNSTLSIHQIAESFSQQAEYRNNFPDPSNVRGNIDALYVNLFGHHADAAGLNYWANQVQSGQITIGGVAITVLFGASGIDYSAVYNKVLAANVFTQHIDTALEVNAYSPTYASSFPLAKAWMSQVTADYATERIAEATVDQTLAVMVSLSFQGVAAHTASHEAAAADTVQLVGVSPVTLDHSLLM